MGRRSRKRPPPDAERRVEVATRPKVDARRAERRPTRPVRRRPRLEEAPPAPWHPFPLVELSILAGLVLIGVGFASDPGEPRTTLLFGGLALVGLASLELAIREHFAGYRSHTTLLAGLPAVLVAAVAFFAKAPWPVVSASAVATFAVAFVALRTAFRRRSGGLSFR